ncbi:hypothetical protein N9L71_05450 [Verrucomicrobiales bacterium]|nr:hypothetical protein [Verrucomicrobiales bacterium]
MIAATRAAVWAGAADVALTSELEKLLARVENDIFQFCTTKAYDWPLPWQINYCSCEGGKIVYPSMSIALNIGMIKLFGIILLLWKLAVTRVRAGSSADNSRAQEI